MKADAWEAGHRMPFVVRWPGKVEAGTSTDQLICFTDVLATLASITGTPLSEGAGADSFGFLPVLQGTQPVDRPVRPGLVMASGNGMMSIRSGNWKFIDGLGSGGFSKPGRIEPDAGQPAGQLYDLETDPAESRNLYADYPEVVTRLSNEMQQVRETGHVSIQDDELQESSTRPNIILVMADDQGWGQTSYNNHPILKTPNLDAMAAAGLRFDRFYAAAPVCSPTRASVLTGRTNRRTGVESHGYALRRQEQSIATLLRDAGYATGHFGKWHLNGLRGPGAPVLAGDTHHPGVFGFDTWLSVTNFFDMNPLMSRNGVFEEFGGDSSEIIVDQAIEFMRQQADADKPFFAVIWYGTPHSPFMADETDIEPFADLPDERSRNQLAELVAMDRSIGTLRASLRDLQIADDTIVWFTSDNGGLPNLLPDTVGGLRGNKRSLYEGGLRVPGIVEWPAQIGPRVTSYPAVSMDIVATIADLAGIPSSQLIWPQDGISLRPLFHGELQTRANPIPFSCFKDSAVIDNNFKLLRLGGDEQVRYELYDLDNDPAEQTNLYESRPGIATRMTELLDQQNHSIQQSIAGADYPEGSVNPGEPPPHSWIDDPRYVPYFDEWRDRPEYRSWLRGK